VPVADTLKRSDGEHRVVATEPREGLWQAQTPQMFRHGMLLRALRDAEHVTTMRAQWRRSATSRDWCGAAQEPEGDFSLGPRDRRRNTRGAP